MSTIHAAYNVSSRAYRPSQWGLYLSSERSQRLAWYQLYVAHEKEAVVDEEKTKVLDGIRHTPDNQIRSQDTCGRNAHTGFRSTVCCTEAYSNSQSALHRQDMNVLYNHIVP